MHAALAILGTLAILATSSRAAAQVEVSADELAVRKLVVKFLVALNQNDQKTALSTFSARSPNLAEVTKNLPGTLEYMAKKPIQDLEFLTISMDGAKAFGLFQFAGKWSKLEEVFDDETVTVLRFECRREGGAWKLWVLESAVLPLVRYLVDEESKEARLEVLKGSPGLVTKRLRLLLEVLAEDAVEEGEPEMALKIYRHSLEAAHIAGNKRWIASHLLEMGVVLWPMLSRPREAIEVQREAMRLVTNLGDMELRVTALIGLGGALADIGKTDEAAKWLREGLVLTRDSDPGQLRATVLNLLGMNAARAGHPEEARRLYRESRARAKADGRKDLELQALAHLAPLLRDLGDLGAAFAVCSEGLELAKGLDEAVVEGKLLNTMGLVHRDTGEFDRALEAYDGAIQRWTAKGLNRLAAICLNNKGDTQFLKGHHDAARESYEAALELAKTIPHHVMIVSIAHNNLGLLDRLAGKLELAIGHYRTSLATAAKHGYARGQMFASCNLAELFFIRKQYDVALEGFRSIQTIAQEAGAIDGQFFAQVGIGRTLARRNEKGDLAAAAQALRAALTNLEHTRSSLSDPMMQQGFFAQSAHVCFFLADTLLRFGRDAEAFAVAEQAKGRTIVDILTSGRVRIVKAMTDAERRQEFKLEDLTTALTKKLDTTFLTDEREELTTRIQSARTQLEDFRRQVFQRQPKLQTLRGRFQPATLQQIHDGLFADAPDLCVLSYLVSLEEILLFALRKGERSTELKVYRIPYKDFELESIVDAFWSECAVAGSPYREHGRELFELLLAPAKDQLKGATHVAIIPDGALHRLPFHALVGPDGKHLVEARGVSYAPSVTALIEMKQLAERRRQDRETKLEPMLALGAPVMPEGYAALEGARAEVESVAKSFAVDAITGKDATEERAKSMMPGVRRIHLATHGKVNERSPMYSFLVLARDDGNDGLLHAREIADMDLSAELVVLSACETGRGKQVRGEGLVGLTWSLLVAGAPSQIVSHWQVSDIGTQQWMADFYAGLERGKLGKAATMRRAHRAALGDSKRAHPYHWAPFFLVGDWR